LDLGGGASCGIVVALRGCRGDAETDRRSEQAETGDRDH
jgi:hypothetical protein